MATAASQSAVQAINQTFRAGSAERHALIAFVTTGVNVNTDREAARLVVQHWTQVLGTIRQTWGL